MIKRGLPLILFLILANAGFAQNFLSWQLNDRYFSGQFGGGFASYRGELKHNGSFQNEISNLSLGLETRLLNKIAVRLEIGRYNLRGHDKHATDSSFARQRNLSFTSVNYEASLMGIFYLRKYKGDYYKRWKVDPYLLGGIGATFFSPKAELGEVQYNLYELKTETADYNRVTMTLPVGMGIKWRLSPFINFITEITYRYTFSDYLDDVSGDFPDAYPDLTTELLSNRKDEIGLVNEEAYDLLASGNPRGNSDDRDAYLFLNLKFEIYFPPQLLKKK